MSDAQAAQILAEMRELRALIEPVLSERGRRMPDRPMSPAEFAKVIGKHPKTVKRWIGKGKLKVRREGKTILISPVNAQRFLNPPERERGWV